MGVRESTIVGSTLLAICFLASGLARTMELSQPGAPAYSGVLPSFLDDGRLPDLQEAWRARRQDNTLGGGEPPAEDSMAATRAAMEKAKARRAGRGDASVRQRAEELSRRFGAGSEASAPASERSQFSATTPPAVRPEAPSDMETQALPQPEPSTDKIQVPKQKPVTTTGALTSAEEVQPLDASVRTQSAMTMEKLRLAAPLPPSNAVPPLPGRAPKVRRTAAAPRPSTRAVVRARSPNPPADPLAALRGTVLTNELGAFGWNSQPK